MEDNNYQENEENHVQWYRASPKVINSTFYTVEFDKLNLNLETMDLERCTKCQGYLNCYCEVLSPGQKWVCVLCGNVNETNNYFIYKNNNFRQAEAVEDYNRMTFEHPALMTDIYELEAPEGFNIKTTDAPILVFNVEVTIQAQRNGLLPSLFTSIKESLQRVINNNVYDSRTRVAFLFYADNLYMLNNNTEVTVVTGAMPQMLKNEISFNLYDDFNTYTEIFDKLEEYFARVQSNNNCLLQSIQFITSVFRSASVYSFVCSMPNTGSGVLKESNKMAEAEAYLKVSSGLEIKSIAVNIFMCTKQTLEFAQFKPITKTGGQVFHYTNYDGEDSTYTEKLHCDLTNLINSNVSYCCLMRIRTSENLTLNKVFGNCIKRSNGLISYGNFNANHAISFMVQGEQGGYIQMAMVRTRNTGIKTIRIATIKASDRTSPFYNNTNQCALGFFQMAIDKEISKPGTGGVYLDQTLKNILNSNENNCINKSELAMYFSAYKKNRLMDQSISTDFRAYYAYLFTNSFISVSDKLTYPILLDHYNTEQMLPLSRQSINDNSIYIMDAGIYVYIFVGRDNETYKECFDGDVTSGLCLLDNLSSTEQGKFMAQTISWLNSSSNINPKYILVLDREGTPLSEIFRRHLYDDAQKNIPNAMSYYNGLINN